MSPSRPLSGEAPPAPMSVNLPRGKALLDLAGAPDLLTVEEWGTTGHCPEGYLQIERESRTEVLLFYRSRVHSAARIQGEESERVPLADWLRGFERKDIKRSAMFRTDAGLLLLLAVTLQNRPLIRGPSSVIDIDKVLRRLAVSGESAALMLRSGPDRTLVFCAGGLPSALYPPGRPPVAKDQILGALLQLCRGEIEIEVFLDLDSRRDAYADVRFEAILSGDDASPGFLLTVHKGSQVLQQRLLKGARATLGRSPACDIVIDHTTVSREHCCIEWRGQRFVLTDLASANGTLLNGRRTPYAALAVGDVITVGDFDVTFGESREALQQGGLQTMFLPSVEKVSALLEYNGAVVEIDAPVFTLGKAKTADLQLRGWRLLPIQATIVREARAFRLLPAAGGKVVTRTGEAVGSDGVLLAEGDIIRIGAHELRFLGPPR